MRIGPATLDLIDQVPKAPDVTESVHHWLTAAQIRNDVYYFGIFRAQLRLPVGQIFLHDMDQTTGESLIGYHLFQPEVRGQGIGTHALSLVQQFVVSTTALTKLIIITSRENRASQAIAHKCGFTYAGAPREDPEHGVVFSWSVPQAHRELDAA